jgi:hypothetical protein
VKNSTIILVVAISGLAGGFASSLIDFGSSPAPIDGDLRPVDEDRGSRDWEGAIESLRQENMELRGRLIALESKEPVSGRFPLGGAVSKAEFDSLEQEIRGFRLQPVDSPKFEEKVASALTQIRQEEQIEAARRGQEKWSAQIDGRVDRVSEWLVMTDYQAEQYRVTLQSKDRRNQELVQMWEDGAEREQLGEIKSSNSRQHIDDVALFLNAEQLETYAARIGGGKD